MASRLVRLLKIASRTRSLVGRMSLPLGARSRRPRAVPATTRMASVYLAREMRGELRFSAEPPGCVALFSPRGDHEGAPGFLHGGVAATCLDETMAALGYVLDRVHCVTATLNLRYRRPVPIDAAPLRLEAWRDRPESRRRQKVHGRLLLPDGTVAVEASGIFVQAVLGTEAQRTEGSEQ